MQTEQICAATDGGGLASGLGDQSQAACAAEGKEMWAEQQRC